VGAVHFRTSNLEQAIFLLAKPLRDFVDGCRALPSRDEVAGLHRITQLGLRSEAAAEEIHPARPGKPTGREALHLPHLIDGRSFVRQRIPINQNDFGESFINLISLDNEYPILLVRRDNEPQITICSGQPSREDFWFLREKHGGAPDGDGSKVHQSD
jgi:hypothetical protein